MKLTYQNKAYQFRDLGPTLRMLRKNSVFTQEEIAQQLCVSRQTYSFWESGRSEIPLLSFLQLAIIYKMTLEELIHTFLMESEN
jgi:transcriptional regulator with XRE-family HTH domain